MSLPAQDNARRAPHLQLNVMPRASAERRAADSQGKRPRRLRRFASLSPYLVILLLPGSVVLLPLFAWWDRRRRKSTPVKPPKL